jgi:hypothetical protein
MDLFACRNLVSYPLCRPFTPPAKFVLRRSRGCRGHIVGISLRERGGKRGIE